MKLEIEAQNRAIELATRMYLALLASAETQRRLDDGEEPGELHAELARRSLNAAHVFAEQLRDEAWIETARHTKSGR